MVSTYSTTFPPFFHAWLQLTRGCKFRRHADQERSTINDQITAFGNSVKEQRRAQTTVFADLAPSVEVPGNCSVGLAVECCIRSVSSNPSIDFSLSGTSRSPANSVLNCFEARAKKRKRLHDILQQQKHARENMAAEARRTTEAKARLLQEELCKKAAAERRARDLREKQLQERRRALQGEMQTKQALADQFRQIWLMKFGFDAWMALADQTREKMTLAVSHYDAGRQRTILLKWYRATKDALNVKERDIRVLFDRVITRTIFAYFRKIIRWEDEQTSRVCLVVKQIRTRAFLLGWRNLTIDLQIKRHYTAIACREKLSRLWTGIFLARWTEMPARMRHQRIRNMHLLRLIAVVRAVLPDFTLQSAFVKFHELELTAG